MLMSITCQVQFKWFRLLSLIMNDSVKVEKISMGAHDRVLMHHFIIVAQSMTTGGYTKLFMCPYGNDLELCNQNITLTVLNRYHI